jgi:broad specificity phosphatase PhoE
MAIQMDLYVARHGETLSNLEKRLTGREGDPLLTEKGIEQAKKLGEILKDIAFDAVYSSPLNRAVDTVKIAFGDKYKICMDDRLAEIGLGIMNDMTYEDASKYFPKSGMLFFTDPTSYIPPTKGESLNNMVKRISSFLDDIAKKNYANVFIMTHGYAMCVLYACAIDQSISTIAKSPSYSNGDVVHFTYEDGKWKLN